MKRPAFLFRPNMRRKDHKTAWDILNSQAAGNKADYIVNTIMQAENKPVTQDVLRKIIQEELSNLLQNNQISYLSKPNEQTSTINVTQEVPDIMLDFLNGLDL